MKPPLMKLLGLALASISLSACVATDTTDGDQQDSSATAYTPIEEFGPTGAEDAWYGLTSTLNGEFSNVCGDTFCEGDFSNITPLRLFCSVTSKVGNIHDCAWTFTASQHEVDTNTAVVANNVVTYQCHFKPATTGPKLIALLQGSTDALQLALPGMGSIYDALGACFQHPIGATPITLSPPTTTYVDAADYYVSPASVAKWEASLTALHQGFDNICGDTFCGSDFSDVQALDLGCSITKSSGNVKSCVWIFGGSVTNISKTGADVPTTKTFSCPIAMHGTMAQLVSALAAPGADAIQTPLPGVTTSAYDALGGCLP
jgi:hypothetical protein